MMDISQLQPGDIIYAAVAIHNDGGIPDIEPEALIAETGARGVLVNIGHVEADPDQELFLVRFENADGNLGPPVGCLAEELKAEPESA